MALMEGHTLNVSLCQVSLWRECQGHKPFLEVHAQYSFIFVLNLPSSILTTLTTLLVRLNRRW
jgi:hypothetical protein